MSWHRLSDLHLISTSVFQGPLTLLLFSHCGVQPLHSLRMVPKWIITLLVGTSAAQYFPPTPEGLKVVESKHHEGVKISYKEVRSTIMDSQYPIIY